MKFLNSNINPAGTVDGTNIAAFKSAYDTHAADVDAHHTNANDPTADQKDAIDGANTPSSSNPFATMNDIGGGGYSGFERILEGDLSEGILMYYRVPEAMTISEALATLYYLPVGASVKVDVCKNGYETTDSIFSSDVPIEITEDQTAESSGLYTSTGTLDSGMTSCDAGDILYVVIKQVGSTDAGFDLSVQVGF